MLTCQTFAGYPSEQRGGENFVDTNIPNKLPSVGVCSLAFYVDLKEILDNLYLKVLYIYILVAARLNTHV